MSQFSAVVNRHRRALVLAGARDWCVQSACTILNAYVSENVLWISDSPPPGVKALKAAQAQQVLGCETTAVVFDAFGGFDTDAFGAVAGTVQGGGILILLSPPMADWPVFDDPEYARIAVFPYRSRDISGRFLQRLARVVAHAQGVTVIAQGEDLPPLFQQGQSQAVASSENDIYRTQDQRTAVEAILKVATGHRRRPVVLISDRGRGKSAALGIAAAQLLLQGVGRIITTAPRLDAVEAVFDHARRLLPDASMSKLRLQLGEAVLEFAPPDELFLAPKQADLLLVDEAAAIPTHLLERLLQCYARIVFATTVHGYEGTGRGFAIRFYKVLDRKTPGWKAVHLETPIRWATDDPLEKFVFRALLLDASAAPDDAVAAARPENIAIERVDRNALVEDESTLCELFGLLVLAHYRTRPYDLRQLLDGLNLSVYVARFEGHVVATALVAEEGGLPSELAREIYAGRRRLRGHLIPQSMAAHLGLEDAATFRYGRVMRIAVHPAVQDRGLGTALLNAIVQDAREDGLDGVGASFGATVELLRFWQRSGFYSVRLGLTREHTSGTHSVMLLYPVTNRAEVFFKQARERFLSQLPDMLADVSSDVDPDLAAALLRRDKSRPINLDMQDWRDVVAFAFGLRGYEVSLIPIRKLLLIALADPDIGVLLDERSRDMLIAKVLQRKSWQEVAALSKHPGRAGVVAALREALQPVVKCYGDAAILEEIDRIKQPS